MEYGIERIDDNGPFWVRTRGRMTGADFLVMAEDLLRQKKDGCPQGVVFDHRDLDFSRVTIKDLEMIRGFHSGHEQQIGNGKCAIVLQSGGRSQWEQLWAQGQKIETGNDVRLFEDSKEALLWVRAA